METEKIYYAILIFITAVSMLLSPFAYVRHSTRRHNKLPTVQRWKWIWLSNLIAVLILLFIAAWWLIGK